MKPGIISLQDRINRRIFLRQSAGGMGLAALASLAGNAPAAPAPTAKAKRVIYLFQSGAPSQADLFDPKPGMEKRRGEDLPASIRMGQRLTTMTSGQGKFPVAPSAFKFKQHGKSFDRCTPRRSTTTRRSPSSTPVHNCRAGPASAHGSVTASAARTRTCLRMSS